MSLEIGAAADVAEGKRRVETPEEVVKYLVESNDCQIGSPRLQPFYSIIRNAPGDYERLIRERVRIPAEDNESPNSDAQDRLARAVSLIHLLGPVNGTRVASDIYEAAAAREKAARRLLAEDRARYGNQRSPASLQQLRRRDLSVARLVWLRARAADQLGQLGSRDLIPQAVASFPHESLEMKIWLVKYFAAVRDADTLIVALRHSESEEGSVRRRVLAALETMRLTEAQRREIASLTDKGK